MTNDDIAQRICTVLDTGGLLDWEVQNVWPEDVEAYARDKKALFDREQSGDCGLTVAEIAAYVQGFKDAVVASRLAEDEYNDRMSRAFDREIRQRDHDAALAGLELLSPAAAYDAWVTYRARYEAASPEDREEMPLP